MAESRCGKCTLCCRLCGIHELNKPVNVWCQHCDIGVGCKIYETRPQGCHDFECLFYQNPQMSEELRPSNCKVVFEVFKPNIILALTDPDRPDAWRAETVLRVIKSLAATGKSVVITNQKTQPVFVLPESRTAEDVLAEISNEVDRRLDAGNGA